jgi:hypothetical protein
MPESFSPLTDLIAPFNALKFIVLGAIPRLFEQSSEAGRSKAQQNTHRWIFFAVRRCYEVLIAEQSLTEARELKAHSPALPISDLVRT